MEDALANDHQDKCDIQRPLFLKDYSTMSWRDENL